MNDPFDTSYDFEKEAYMDSEADSLNDMAKVRETISQAISTISEAKEKLMRLREENTKLKTQCELYRAIAKINHDTIVKQRMDER
jgi:hypothetical protein